jgi:hypothetical protein
MKYKFEAAEHGIVTKTDAPIVGKELVRIEKKSGAITPQIVVESAQPSQSPMHKYFTWDDGEAADKCRLDEARQLVRSVVIVRVTKDDSGDSIRAFVSVKSSNGEKAFDGQAYISTVRALRHATYREQVLADALRELNAWKDRYQHLKELSAIVGAIEQLDIAA